MCVPLRERWRQSYFDDLLDIYDNGGGREEQEGREDVGKSER